MIRFRSISEFLAYRQLPPPEHPLITVFEVQEVGRMVIDEPISWMYDFYAIGLKHVANANEVRLKYGQQAYDYNNGILSFVAPGQVMRFEVCTRYGDITTIGMDGTHPSRFTLEQPVSAANQDL